MIDYSHLSTNEAFVAYLFDTALDADPMSVDDAAKDLAMLRAEEDWEVPEDLTPEEFAEIWNRICADARKEDPCHDLP